MLIKNQKIIKSVLNPQKKQFAMVAFDSDTGFYYAMDGYRIVRIEPMEFHGAALPIFDINSKLPNYKLYFEDANKSQYKNITIPYTANQIEKWYKENLKAGNKKVYTFGERINIPNRRIWFGINPKFLIDAMRTTGSQIVSIPDKGNKIIIQGKGYVWIICPVACKDDYECNHYMTEILIK